MRDFFTFSSSVLPDTTRVLGFRGTEALSRPYVFEIYLSIPSEESGDVDLDDAVGAKGTLRAQREDDGEQYVIHGLLSGIELVQQAGSAALFRATLVPRLWELTQTLHSRMFTKKSVREIIEFILDDSGFSGDDYEFKLYGDYEPEEHVCQYQESNLDFISRWMEREGLYYYFEQGEDAEKLVITDNKSFHEPLRKAPVPYHPQAGGDMNQGEAFDSFTRRHQHLPSAVKLHDYDYTNPTLDVSGHASVSQSGFGEITMHGARFFNPTQGKRLAGIRAEELLARKVLFHATGTAYHLRPGYLFELEEHPRTAFNGEYLTTELVHICCHAVSAPQIKKLLGAEANDVYRVEVAGIPASVQFRAERRTPWPRIYGYENAVIDGDAESEYAQIDEHGRYNVKFMFDETSLKGSNASTWVRMAQPHGGSIEGWHFPLRKGTEVVISFMGGDPDRPVIMGVVPNAHTPSPVTQGNNTKNVIQTGGRNRLELEDKAGQQRITMSTPTENTYLRMGSLNDEHNFIGRTDGSALIYTGTHFDIEVVDFKTESVGNYVDHVYKGPYTCEVEKDVTLTYKANRTEKVESGHVQELYQSQNTEVQGLMQVYAKAGQQELFDDMHYTVVSAGGRTQEVTGLLNVKAKSGYTVEVTGDAKETATGDWSIEANAVDTKSRGEWKWSCLGDKVSLTIGATSETLIGLKNENLIGGKLEILGPFKMETVLGIKVDSHIGVAIEANAAIALKFAPTWFENLAGKIEMLPYKLINRGIDIEVGGLKLIG
ncbi:type VI secretion system Vgr family protein [Polyangium spumosum]|uniref:Type VI secretion system tip protein VgrG n=1 Tax=Polyangium spumosum TaxID=889282 RepID=A0A6N7PEE8_9BACT|nr:type VI secretion system tip protein TssI/VgrG [Polyangium spumosum]MRG90398.1 type VI secretion system tip protein VgrG [Polyangium spumosum]